jgi:hypothetical protein
MLAEAQALPGGQVAVLWALAALQGEQAGNAPAAADSWENAERTAAAAGELVGRAGLAARAQAALGPVDADDPSGDPARPDP